MFLTALASDFMRENERRLKANSRKIWPKKVQFGSCEAPYLPRLAPFSTGAEIFDRIFPDSVLNYLSMTRISPGQARNRPCPAANIQEIDLKISFSPLSLITFVK
jgi:hypothetical protein